MEYIFVKQFINCIKSQKGGKTIKKKVYIICFAIAIIVIVICATRSSIINNDGNTTDKVIFEYENEVKSMILRKYNGDIADVSVHILASNNMNIATVDVFIIANDNLSDEVKSKVLTDISETLHVDESAIQIISMNKEELLNDDEKEN